MHDKDIAILRQLAANGRISLNDLGDAVGLSPTPTARRVKQLEAAGVITGYYASLDETALGFPVSVFVSVRLDKQIDEALALFEEAVARLPEVVDCWLMTGNRDYLMRVATRDLADFERFLTHRLTKIRGVASIESSIPLRRVKATPARIP
ncbi:Lrp/AsnC family transcriptional regulator [Hoeflea sp. G2-23]|uniref:Lrp/AsnC family transcriptional regulator n=1 Tax=Hoeflea algicola TaxID=2983763 RepID=A0ABT3Z3Q5_9HYPH|nr:Lrp/AsnC family transcriptional regulator [Hoeflea algicola]MCY0146398.1 Lrp/AsnC family transcriptional regulator [Hoeflea algicola]